MLRNHVYYSFKPILPRFLRLVVRRYFAKRKLASHSDIWPINEAAGNIPAGWAGWPSNKQFCVVLTHDVESKIGLGKCDQLAGLEETMGFRSSFNFVPEGDYRVPEKLREDLQNRGFEVGVHDLKHNGKLYASESEFRRNAKKINRYLKDWGAVGFRSGFMLRNLELLQELDTLYDASTFDTDPFEPQPDGAKTIYPFWVPPKGIDNQESSISNQVEVGQASPLAAAVNESAETHSSPLTPHRLDLRSQRRSTVSRDGYVELPYTLAQDSTLFLVLQEDSIDLWKRKIDWLIEKGGMILVNVHPDYIDFSGKENFTGNQYPSSLYKQLLEYIKSKGKDNYWHALPKEVATYYKETMVKT